MLTLFREFNVVLIAPIGGDVLQERPAELHPFITQALVIDYAVKCACYVLVLPLYFAPQMRVLVNKAFNYACFIDFRQLQNVDTISVRRQLGSIIKQIVIDVKKASEQLSIWQTKSSNSMYM